MKGGKETEEKSINSYKIKRNIIYVYKKIKV